MSIEVSPSLQELEKLVGLIADSSKSQDTPLTQGLLQNLKFLTSSEQEFVLQKLKELRDTGTFEGLKSIKLIDFKHEPVSIADFLDDPNYMGKVSKILYPKWREELLYVCDQSSPIISWYFSGAVGVGKTTVSLIAQLYKGIYFLSCLKSPQDYFGLEENSRITFGLFNANLANAASVDFARLMNFIDSCKYFKEECPRVPASSYIYFPSMKVSVIEGSKALHTMGTDMFGYCMDEANFMQEKSVAQTGNSVEEQGQAYQIYHHAVRRMESRFLKYGSIPGLACIVSSRKHKTSFLEKLMEEGKHDPKVHISDYSLWEVKGRHIYSPVTFRVLWGDKYRQSEILDIMDPVTQKILRSKPAPLGSQTIDVPADFYKAFDKDINGSLRDICGLPTQALNPLISRVDSIYECIDSTREHPFLKTEHELPLNDPTADLLNFVKWDQLTTVKDGCPSPIAHAGSPRFMHVDLALTGDAVGISMACAYDKQILSELDPITGQSTDRFLPKIWVDFILRIVPVKGTQIDITKIVSFILNLRNKGYPLQRVTFDGFQSAMAIQVIQKAGILPQYKRYSRYNDLQDLNANVLSVDRTDVPYTVLRDCLNYRCINMYRYQPLIDELVELEYDIEKKKVDHPGRGSKDVADSICGTVYNIATSASYIQRDPINEVIANNDHDIAADMMSAIMPPVDIDGNVIQIVPEPKQVQSHDNPRARHLSSGLKLNDFNWRR